MNVTRDQFLPIGAFLLFLISIATEFTPLFYVALVFMTIAVVLNVRRLVKRGRFILAILAIVIFITAIVIVIRLPIFDF